MDELNAQINQMKQALAAASDTDKPGLELMIQQLEELLHGNLTEPSSASPLQNSDAAIDTGTEDEFLRFQAEIAALGNSSSQDIGGTNSGVPNSKSNLEVQEAAESADFKDEHHADETQADIENELSALEGMKCKAPHEHHWGQVGYYNAIVLNIESSDGDSLDTIMVRVLFSQPVAESMLPCQYFMEGRCRFEDASCKFSHGEIVPLSELREYSEPDFSRIKSGSRVLAKYSDGLWYKATISEISESNECKLKYDSYEGYQTVPLHETTPLYDDHEGTDVSELESDSEEDSDEDISQAVDDDEVRNLWMFQMKATGPLGEWEKYTKGIGSKLMAKMGYVVGTGLGPRGDGRIEPVDAVVLPRGRSLDTCMELKEKAGNGSIFSVEKRLKRMKKKEEQRAKRDEEKRKSSESLFNFLNAKLCKTNVKAAPKEDLGKETSKNLNRKMLNLEQNIKQVHNDIARLRESMKRHQDKDKATAEKFRLKLESMEKHLSDLQRSEESVKSEQRQRSDKKKLSIF